MCLGVIELPAPHTDCTDVDGATTKATACCSPLGAGGAFENHVPISIPSVSSSGHPETDTQADTKADTTSLPESFSERQTIVIFDWDDTLLCTTFLRQWEGRQMPAVVMRHLQGVERAVRHLLETALRLGQVFIITNATLDWVGHTARKAMPGLLPLLQNVPVISARDRYADQHPEDIGKWKTLAFLDLQREFDSNILANIISLGDSTFEMDAAHVMSGQFARAQTKTIKFHQHPTAEELLKQLQCVTSKFEVIISANKCLKIGLERKTPSAARAA